jgi:hypothetical protein
LSRPFSWEVACIEKIISYLGHTAKERNQMVNSFVGVLLARFFHTLCNKVKHNVFRLSVHMSGCCSILRLVEQFDYPGFP